MRATLTVPSKLITTLIDDIYGLFGSGQEPSQEAVDDLAKALANHVRNAMAKREPKGHLRGSVIGTECERKLYYTVNHPEDAEPFQPQVHFKFLYGNLIEEMVLFLAQQAGHKVEKRQHKVTVEGIEGHIDAVIDGVLIDVKSASGRAMDKFKNHQLEHDDPFGYLKQIDFYKEGMKDDPSVVVKGSVGFLAVNKEQGGLVLDMYQRTPTHARELLASLKNSIASVSSPETPARGYKAVQDGASGNMKLGTVCSYCAYKDKCWQDANDGTGLRKFFYSTGPKWLTKVFRLPNVPESS